MQREMLQLAFRMIMSQTMKTVVVPTKVMNDQQQDIKIPIENKTIIAKTGNNRKLKHFLVRSKRISESIDIQRDYSKNVKADQRREFSRFF